MKIRSKIFNQSITEYVLKIWFFTGLFYAIALPTLEANNEVLNVNYLSNVNYWSSIVIFLLTVLLVNFPMYVLLGSIIKFFTINKFIIWLSTIVLSILTFFTIGAISVDKMISDSNYPILLYSVIVTIFVFILKLNVNKNEILL